MDDIEYLYASNGSGEAPRLTITALRTAGATTLVVDSVTNWPDHFVATSGTLNVTTGLLEPATIKVFRGSIDGANLDIEGFAPGYTDTGHTVGQVVVLKPTTDWADLLADTLTEVKTRMDVSINTDGSLTAAAIESTTDSRRIARISVTTDTPTLTPTISTDNYYRITAQTTALSIANPTGTPTDGEGLLFEITGTAARAISWGSDYEANSQYGLTLPTTTVTTKTTFITFVWSTARSKWLAVM